MKSSSAAEPSSQGLDRFPWLAPLSVGAVGFLLYVHTLSSPFRLDDYHTIVENLHIRTLGDPLALLIHAKTRALTLFTFALNYAVHEDRLFGYHLVNTLIHAANGVLVYWLALLLCRAPALAGRHEAAQARWLGLLAGVLFVAHPLQVQAVAYIVQRLESLAAGFYLLSVALYIEARLRRSARRNWSGWYAASLAVGVLGTFAKETVVTLPGAVVLIEICLFRGRRANRPGIAARIALAAPYVLVGLLVPLTLLILTPTRGAFGTDLSPLSGAAPGQSQWEYFITQFRVVAAYLRLTLLPAWQSFDPYVRTSRTLWEGVTLGSLAALALILGAAVSSVRRWPLQAVGVLWVFLTLSPTSSVVPIFDLMFEHRMYLPLAGAALTLAAMFTGAWRLLQRRGLPARAAVACVVAVVVLFGALTIRRNWTWMDGDRLWADTVRKSPGKSRPYVNFGVSQKRGGAADKAMLLFLRVLRADAKYRERNADVWNNAGDILIARGLNDHAMVFLKMALWLDPNYGQAHNNLAVLAVARGRFNEALQEARLAAARAPHLSSAHINQGAVYFKTQRPTKALAAFLQAQHLEPRNPLTAENVASAFHKLGLMKRALAASRYLLRLAPNNALARQNVRFLEQQINKQQ